MPQHKAQGSGSVCVSVLVSFRMVWWATFCVKHFTVDFEIPLSQYIFQDLEVKWEKDINLFLTIYIESCINMYARFWMRVCMSICAGRHPHFQSICESGEKLRSEGHLASKAIGHRLTQLQDKWKKLSDMTATRKTRLEEAAQSQQVRESMREGEGMKGKSLVREEVKVPGW